MTQAERERRHRVRLAQINQVQSVQGLGDRLRVDHEATLLERARLYAEELRSHDATERGLAAFERLLHLAEDRGSPHAQDIVEFIAAVRDRQPLPLLSLCGVDPAVGDDMIAVLDAFRYGRVSLPQQVAGGPARVARACRSKR